MARARLISKSLGSSRRFHALLSAAGKLGEFSQVLFVLIIPNTDDFGRMTGDAFTVKNVVLPSSPRSEADFERALDALQAVDLIDRYQVADVMYLQVRQFDEHQANLHKRTESKFPESPGISGKTRLNLTEFNLTESKRKETNTRAPGPWCEGFEQFWEAYPKKKAKGAARKAWDHHRPDGALQLTILAAIADQRQSHDWLTEGGRFIPYPATWLARSQWSDDPATPVDTRVSDTTRSNLAARDALLARVKESA